MKRQNSVREITLADLWRVFVRHLAPIILAALLCVALLFAYGTFILTPKYSSTSTLYILKQENSNDYVYTQSDFNLALNIINDCSYMVKSHEVLDRVIRDLDLDMDYETLSNTMTISNPDNTRVLEITVETKDAELSKNIANSISKTAAYVVNDTLGLDQVNMYSSATASNEPSNSIGTMMYAVAGIAAAIVSYSVYLIAFMLDDKIKTEEDVEKYLGLSILGEIPNSSDVKRNSGKYAYYSNSKKHAANDKKGGKAK